MYLMHKTTSIEASKDLYHASHGVREEDSKRFWRSQFSQVNSEEQILMPDKQPQVKSTRLPNSDFKETFFSGPRLRHYFPYR